MPCRRPGGERLLLLERAAVSFQTGGGGGGSGSVVGAGSGSKEVDALVAKLGEVLQLSAQHPSSAAPSAAVVPPRLLLTPKHRSRDRAAPYASPRGLGFFTALHRHPSAPPPPPPPPSAAPTDQKGSPRVAKQLCGRGWLRSAARTGGKKRRRHLRHLARRYPLLPGGDDDDDEDDDPHRLLEQLILSGNLIKEAVRRLQLAASAAAVDVSPAGSTGSSCHSSSGEGEASAPPALP